MEQNLDNKVERYLAARIEEIENLDEDNKVKAEKQFTDMYNAWSKSYDISCDAIEKKERLEFDKDRTEQDRRIKALESEVEFKKLELEREKMKQQRGIDIIRCKTPVIQTGMACGFGVIMLGIEKSLLNEGGIISTAVRNYIPKLKFF